VQHTQTQNLRVKAQLEIKKKKNLKSQPYSGNTTETGYFELLSTVLPETSGQISSKNISRSLLCKGKFTRNFLSIYTSKSPMKQS